MATNPMNQFEVYRIGPEIKIGTIDISFTNASLFMVISAIFICVLDEVDAPLDDANVTRFCNLLNELTKITSTRFIIVTHHALTMSKMDRLYGVTMPEKGISQLVAVDLQKAESMVA